MSRRNADYVAPAQTLIFLGDVWIDDACEIQYTVQDEKFPQWGWNDRFYRAVSQGRTLINGRLAIKFRSLGYLTRTISRSRELFPEEENAARAQIRQFGVESPDELRNISQIDVAEIVRRVAIGSSPRPEDVSDLRAIEDRANIIRRINGHPATTGQTVLRTRHDEDQPRDNVPEVAELIRPSYQIHREVTLMLVYGDPEDVAAPERVELLTQVQFVGESKVLTAEVPGGGEAIVEEYAFFARDKRPVNVRDGSTFGLPSLGS